MTSILWLLIRSTSSVLEVKVLHTTVLMWAVVAVVHSSVYLVACSSSPYHTYQRNAFHIHYIHFIWLPFSSTSAGHPFICCGVTTVEGNASSVRYRSAVGWRHHFWGSKWGQRQSWHFLYCLFVFKASKLHAALLILRTLWDKVDLLRRILSRQLY